jgi:hypothetical protein
MGFPFSYRYAKLTIADGGDTTGLVDIRGVTLLSFQVPTITGANLSVLGARHGDDTPAPINDSDGNVVAFAKPTAGEWVTLTGADADAVAAFPWIALKSDGTEDDERTIHMVGKSPG